jgi:NADH-quinone oxidoreductase subunit G
VIALTAYRSAELLASADCLLPIATFTETAGTFVNAAGTVQSFNGVVRPFGQARPAWKVLRVLGNLLELSGFDADSAEQVRAQVLPAEVGSLLSNRIASVSPAPLTDTEGWQRVADVPIYAVDPIVRRAPSLQQTRDARAPSARMNAQSLARLGLAPGERVVVRQGRGSAVLPVELDPGVAADAVRIAAAHESTAGLGPMFGQISLERAQ